MKHTMDIIIIIIIILDHGSSKESHINIAVTQALLLFLVHSTRLAYLLFAACR
jgi:hypothetical protein